MRKLLERYLNGIIWFEDNGKKKGTKYEKFVEAQELMGRLEEQLREQGITTAQLDKIIYYGKYFHEVFKTTKVTENVINYVLKNIGLSSLV